MPSLNDLTKGCGPQPFVPTDPSHATSLAQLKALAKCEQDALDAGERAATPCYWRLGQILSLARRRIPRGAWVGYLQELKIEKTRASKALAIFRTFASLDELDGLSVSQAYAQRTRTPRFEPRPTEQFDLGAVCPVERVTLPRWVYTFGDDVERLRDEAQVLTETELAAVLAAIGRAEQLLVDLKSALERQRQKLSGPVAA